VTKIFVLGHLMRPEVPGLVGDLVKWASGGGHKVWMMPADAEALGLPELASDAPPSTADVAVCLGGDGTVLRAVQVIDGASVPILGVNVGTLGYLTEVEPSDIVKSLVRWMTGKEGEDFTLDSRMLLKVAVRPRDGSASTSWRALNEVVLEKQMSGHTIWLDLFINDLEFARYSADGLIVSTPTGSTAYSLSARGPVVSPRHRAMLITPVSPHMMFDRSLVLDPQELVHIRVVGTRPVDMAVDGRKVASLSCDDVVECSPDESSAQFLRFGASRFHQIVRAKFSLGEE